MKIILKNQDFALIVESVWRKNRMTDKRRYKRAFHIACELLNANYIYGVNTDNIFAYIMERDESVCSFDLEDFILNNLDRFSDNTEVRNRAIERLGW